MKNLKSFWIVVLLFFACSHLHATWENFYESPEVVCCLTLIGANDARAVMCENQESGAQDLSVVEWDAEQNKFCCQTSAELPVKEFSGQFAATCDTVYVLPHRKTIKGATQPLKMLVDGQWKTIRDFGKEGIEGRSIVASGCELWCLIKKKKVDVVTKNKDIRRWVERWDGTSWQKMGDDLDVPRCPKLSAGADGTVFASVTNQRGYEGWFESKPGKRLFMWNDSTFSWQPIPVLNKKDKRIIADLSVVDADNIFFVLQDGRDMVSKVYHWNKGVLKQQGNLKADLLYISAIPGHVWLNKPGKNSSELYRWVQGLKQF